MKFFNINYSINILNNTEIDIIQWKIISSNRDDIDIKIENKSWKFAGFFGEVSLIPYKSSKDLNFSLSITN